jgi:precorrin-2/cobalt-factor-2 C20-methyltransferase
MTGTLYGIGVGPGDPELVTLKALRLIRACKVIAYPAPEEGPSLARQIVSPHLDGRAEEIAIRMPMEEARYPAQAVYDQAAAEIGARLTDGQDVAVLCQGDPFFYGSFMYLFERLAENFLVEIVPGVSSLGACAAALRNPLVSRNDVLTVIPAPLPEEAIRARLMATDAAAIMKLGRHFEKVRRVLTELGLERHARYIERASMAEQAIRRLDEIPADSAPYFAMILVHRRGSALA